MTEEGVQSEVSISTLKELVKNENVKTATALLEQRVKDFKEGGKLLEASKVYEVMACHDTIGDQDKKKYLRKLQELFAEDLEQQIFINNAGFSDPSRRVKISHCFNRLNVLRALKPGRMCYDKTWGFGIVKEMLLSEQKVCVNFDSKPDHLMVLGHASASVSLIGEEHLLAKKHLDPEGFSDMVKSNPAEVFRIALRSFGPKPILRLQELLIPGIVPQSRWKKFWDAARKELKEDPRVIIPTKRSECIEWLEEELSYDDTWFESLKANTDMESILTQTEEVVRNKELKAFTENQRAILANRLGFVIKGAEGRLHNLMVKSLLFSEKLDFKTEEIGAEDIVEQLFEPACFLEILGSLSGKEIKGFLSYMSHQNKNESMELFKSAVPELGFTSMNEVVSFLLEAGEEKDVKEIFRSHWNSWSLSVAGLCWLNKNLEKLITWGIGQITDLAMRNLTEIKKEYKGEKLRTQNQLRLQFSQAAWLKRILNEMDNSQRRGLTQGIKDSTGWAKLDKASLLGRMVKLYPDLQEVVSDNMREEAKKVDRGPVTSLRSYHERERQLIKLIQEDIPKNSKDIATAREYGDLRENFEYKAAKDQQRLLLQRQADYEEMLRHVTPTDFKNFRNDRVGAGTHVTIQFDDGKNESWNILGEWDGNENLHIISSGSRLAQQLKGHSAGERVMVPTEKGEAECLIESVSELSANVKEWITESV